jgi:Icc-related predicted phosphoesterase
MYGFSSYTRTPQVKPVRIVAVSDVHCPRYIAEFERSLSLMEKPDLFLLAGDMVNRGAAHEYERIVDALEAKIGRDVPILSCLGNEEYEEKRTKLAKYAKGLIRFLDEEIAVLEIAGRSVGIVAGPAPIDRRSKTTELGGRSIRQRFQQRVRRLSSLLEEAAENANYTILLMHYSPLSETTSPGDKQAFSWWISEAIQYARPDLIVHGHTHGATHLRIEMEGTLIYNVAIPVTGVITGIRVPQ